MDKTLPVIFICTFSILFSGISREKEDSLPYQTAKGHYFSLLVKDTTDICSFLNGNTEFQILMERYPDVIVDRNLLVIKRSEKDYRGKDKISLTGIPLSYGESDFRRISLNADQYNEKFGSNATQRTYIYTKTLTDEGPYIISGYYLEENFIINSIPGYASQWIQSYNMLMKQHPIFYADHKTYEKHRFDFSDPISIFIKYFEEKTKPIRPAYKSGDSNYPGKYESYKLKSKNIRDSLFKFDSLFVKLLNEGIKYGLDNVISKDDFHNFAELVSEEDALTLMRCDYPYQECGNSSYYIRRVIDIFDKAKKLKKDSLAIICAARIFFDGSMMLHFDPEVPKSQKVAAEYLLSKNIRVADALMGEILVNESLNSGFGSGFLYYTFYNDTINNQILALLEILEDKDNLEPVGKIALIENLQKIIKSDTLSLYYRLISDKLARIKTSLPEYIQKRMDHQASTFEELYYKEKEILTQNFEVLHVRNGHFLGEGYSWVADLDCKWEKGKAYAAIIHDYYDRTPCWQEYAGKVRKILSLFMSNKLLESEIENNNIERVLLFFSNRSSKFTPKLSGCGPKMPHDLYQKYQDKWGHSVSLSIKTKGSNIITQLILFNDGSFLLPAIHKEIKLGPYRFDDLFSYSEKNQIGPETNYSYKLINVEGKIIH